MLTLCPTVNPVRIQHLHYFAVMEEALEEVCMVSILSESTMNVGIDGFVREVLIDSG